MAGLDCLRFEREAVGERFQLADLSARRRERGVDAFTARTPPGFIVRWSARDLGGVGGLASSRLAAPLTLAVRLPIPSAGGSIGRLSGRWRPGERRQPTPADPRWSGPSLSTQLSAECSRRDASLRATSASDCAVSGAHHDAHENTDQYAGDPSSHPPLPVSAVAVDVRADFLRMIGEIRHRLSSPPAALPGHEPPGPRGPSRVMVADAAPRASVRARATAASIKRWFRYEGQEIALRIVGHPHDHRRRPATQRPPAQQSRPMARPEQLPDRRVGAPAAGVIGLGLQPEALRGLVERLEAGRRGCARETRRQAIDMRPVGHLSQCHGDCLHGRLGQACSRSAPPPVRWSSPSLSGDGPPSSP